MNSRHTERNVLRTAKKILELVGVASLALIFAGPIRAQSKPAPSGVTTSAQVALMNPAPAAQAANPTPATVQAPAQNPSAKKSSPKGQHEGITVHGHWTIEVRDPDGKVVTHREFENSLAPSPIGGANLLAGLLGRLATTGLWTVVLSTGFPTSITFAEPTVQCNPPSTATNTCSNNLTVTVPDLGPNGPGTTLTLAGTGVVPQSPMNSPPTIDHVKTLNAASGTAVGGFVFTQRNLDGVGTDPPAVPVSPGQTVAVTVTFSFQ